MSAAVGVAAQPDVTLVLDREGVIREAALSSSVPDEDLRSWIGRPWVETVVDPGSAKVERIVSDASTKGVSAFRQINQRFPSGLELPIEYTAVRSGPDGLIAVGKSLQAVADLQSRLIAAQQAMERDYWKLRDVETRCRLLFDRSNEAVLLVRAEDLAIAEANPAAIRVLGLASSREGGVGRRLFDEVAPDDRRPFEAMLQRVRDQGKAPGILVGIGGEQHPCLVRASLLPSQDGLVYLLQLTPASPVRRDDAIGVPLEALVEHAPDGFVVIDHVGAVQRANRAFLDLVQVGEESSVVGQPLGRWLGRPGADLAVLLSSVSRRGAVRLFTTTLQGELGAGTEVEVAAAGEVESNPRHIAVWIRDIASRLPVASDAPGFEAALNAFTGQIGRASLPELVREAVGAVERHYINEALSLTAGNRTAAAQLLGVSRQSLYAKLNRYGSDAAEELDPTRLD